MSEISFDRKWCQEIGESGTQVAALREAIRQCLDHIDHLNFDRKENSKDLIKIGNILRATGPKGETGCLWVIFRSGREWVAVKQLQSGLSDIVFRADSEEELLEEFQVVQLSYVGNLNNFLNLFR